MPGENSNFNPSRYDWFTNLWKTNAHIGVSVAVVLISVWGITRYYWIWPERRYSPFMFLEAIFFLSCDVVMYAGLYRTKNIDPGYLLPGVDQQFKAKTSSETEPSSSAHQVGDQQSLCRKCGCKRTHDRVNHCSRCDRCVEYMDHHCIFTDNCIGRRNYKYFFQFVAWADFALVLGLASDLWKM